MIRLYTAPTPNCRKVSIALEELGLSYQVERVRLETGEQLTPAFLAKNPNNKVPVLDDDGLVVWESGAILLHLAEKPLAPRGLLLPRILRLGKAHLAFHACELTPPRNCFSLPSAAPIKSAIP